MSKKQEPIKLNGERVRNFQLNSSLSKMQYSFSQSKRFQEKQAVCSKHVYDLPQIQHKRSASFGLGQKARMQCKNQLDLPGPTAYFKEQNNEKKSGFTFGISRDQAKCYSFLKHDEAIPGPATYERPEGQSLTRSFSMSKSIVQHELQRITDGPGPGKYNINGVSQDGKFILAKYKNNPTVRVPKSKERCKTEHYPGPLDYNPHFLNSKCMETIDSKKATNAFSFGAAKRQKPSFMELSKCPAPGDQYLWIQRSFRFSEFIP